MAELREREIVNGAGEGWPWRGRRRSQKKKVLCCDFTATVDDRGSAEVSAVVTLVQRKKETLRERMVRARRGRERGHRRNYSVVTSIFYPCFTTAAVLRKPSLLVEPATIDIGGPVERRGPATTRPWSPLQTKPPCFYRRESITVNIATVTELLLQSPLHVLARSDELCSLRNCAAVITGLTQS
ncbi:hypothetical protein PIB30_074897 [Stylosanthes scabra]|uniref:Uncharacterized protein n=1 Tax=Stylosanthes scabra TaxID=79078 RepID=A0ABU6RQ46_9FABA|nr:hypothetical protein [Stylosanthes scabra]